MDRHDGTKIYISPLAALDVPIIAFLWKVYRQEGRVGRKEWPDVGVEVKWEGIEECRRCNLRVRY